MSVRHSLLALLEPGPTYGYRLKSEFESATAELWPLNVGQVYTTLGRLERDGLVTVAEGEDGQKEYSITDAGRGELSRWFEEPVEREAVPRHELAIKLVFAVRSRSTDVAAVIQHQRAATMRGLQEFTRLKSGGEPEEDLAWTLLLDGLIFQAEAEVRWLDLCEARLARMTATTAPGPARTVGSKTPARARDDRRSRGAWCLPHFRRRPYHRGRARERFRCASRLASWSP